MTAGSELIRRRVVSGQRPAGTHGHCHLRHLASSLCLLVCFVLSMPFPNCTYAFTHVLQRSCEPLRASARMSATTLMEMSYGSTRKYKWLLWVSHAFDKVISIAKILVFHHKIVVDYCVEYHYISDMAYKMYPGIIYSS